MRTPKTLSRDPVITGYLRAVRNLHRGYQQHGNVSSSDLRTFKYAARAVRRDGAVYTLHLYLVEHGADWLEKLPDEVQVSEWRRGRHDLRSRWAEDNDLRRDLRWTRYKEGDPITAEELQHLVTVAAATFRADIDATVGLSKNPKKRARASAWAKFDAKLSALALTSLAASDSADPALSVVAAGALR